MFYLLLGCVAEATAPPAADCANDARRWKVAEAMLSDWPNLAQYRGQAVDPDGVVFMGDSITARWGGDFFTANGYTNRGIPSQVTGQMLVRFRPEVVAAAPRVVVILGGINDIGGIRGPATDDEIVGNIASMAEIATANGVRVVLATLLPVDDTVGRSPDRVVEVNRRIRELAKAHAYGLADFYAVLADSEGMLPALYTRDGLHPNAAGYARMAPVAKAAVDAALARAD